MSGFCEECGNTICICNLGRDDFWETWTEKVGDDKSTIAILDMMLEDWLTKKQLCPCCGGE